MMQILTPQGWMCPNCGGAHAPHVDTCPTAMKIATTTHKITVSDCNCAPGLRGEDCGNTVCPRRMQPPYTVTAYQTEAQ